MHAIPRIIKKSGVAQTIEKLKNEYTIYEITQARHIAYLLLSLLYPMIRFLIVKKSIQRYEINPMTPILIR